MKPNRVYERFVSNWQGMTGLVCIALIGLVALAGYLITPDDSPHANEQHLELAAMKPGFKVTMLLVRRNSSISRKNLLHRLVNGTEPEYRFVPVKQIGFDRKYLVAVLYDQDENAAPLTETFLLPDILYPIRPDSACIEQGDSISWVAGNGVRMKASFSDLQKKVLSGNIKERKYLLGTDRFGRDLLSRIILGARMSFSVGFIAVSISLLLGLLLGSIAGYYRGWPDRLVLWLIQVIWSVPTLLMVIAITFVLGKGFWQVFVAVGLTMWVEVARVVRGQVLSLREKEYVMAAKAIGLSDFGILFRHILPNLAGPVIIISASNFASAILMEAGLSFLGLGVPPPVPSWGSMIKEHYGYILVHQAYLPMIPGIAIMILVLSFTLAGNALRDAFDTKTV
ncbi:MAG TPA: ABC transporter permease [Bacteroidales bacterium]|nr:ABC transporter permease [Bacteroidales bacterium]